MSSNNRLMKIYTDTILDTKELLNPEQMDNDITNHIKENLKNHYEKKCYKQYGYINKIYKVDKIEETIINSEDILVNKRTSWFIKYGIIYNMFNTVSTKVFDYNLLTFENDYNPSTVGSVRKTPGVYTTHEELIVINK